MRTVVVLACLFVGVTLAGCKSSDPTPVHGWPPRTPSLPTAPQMPGAGHTAAGPTGT
jgi:hypothetical protein